MRVSMLRPAAAAACPEQRARVDGPHQSSNLLMTLNESTAECTTCGGVHFCVSVLSRTHAEKATSYFNYINWLEYDQWQTRLHFREPGKNAPTSHRHRNPLPRPTFYTHSRCNMCRRRRCRFQSHNPASTSVLDPSWGGGGNDDDALVISIWWRTRPQFIRAARQWLLSILFKFDFAPASLVRTLAAGGRTHTWWTTPKCTVRAPYITTYTPGVWPP